MLNWAMGADFLSEKENSVDIVKMYMSFSDDDFLLPNSRMMHQACMVSDGKGGTLLLVIGGKEG